jgi:mono/diheme cytochrome c family protein
MTNFDWFYNALANLGFTDPVHPALAHMPIGLVVGALSFGFVALVWKRPLLGLSARHCLVLAWLFIFPTVLFGVMDWQHFYHGAWLFPIKVKIGLASFLFVVLSTGLIMIFKGQGESKAILVIYGLAFFTVVGLGYFGGRLVFGGQSPATPESFQAGSRIYDANCRACHPNGDNAIMPNMPIRGSDKLVNFQTFNDFIRQPRLPSGANGSMPNFHYKKLSDQEARALYSYVKHAFGGNKP